MSNDNSLVNDPLFYRMIGQQIGNNAHAEADRIRANGEIGRLEKESDMTMMVVNVIAKQRDDALSNVEFLRSEVEIANESEIGYACSIAGVRGVTRELLEELRKSKKKNPLLDKKVRDRIFDAAKDKLVKKISGKTNKERVASFSAESARDEAYGAEGANKGGPEKSKITPNIMVRSEAEVPSHVSDREKFLGLIEKLAAEVKKNNPDAAILKEIPARGIPAELDPQ